MEKSPDYDRIMALLRSDHKPTNEDWAWINNYLSLADSANGNKTPLPTKPEKTEK